MRNAIVVVLFAALCTIGVATAAEKQADQKPTGTIIGKVVDAEGKAAADCIISVAQNAEKMRDPYRATTDADGKCKIEKVAAGDYNLNVRSADMKSRALKS